jgi:SAM-dependent methyltransferase/Tfp pilus assembly protein PilF
MPSSELRFKLDAALALYQSGALADAQRAYADISAQHPDAPDAWNMLAVVLYQQGSPDEAALAAEQATTLRPAIAPYWVMRGNIALARKDRRLAQASFRRATELAPDFAEAHYRLGIALHTDHRYGDAIAAYRAAARAAPDVPEIHWQLAEALLAKGQINAAMRAYQDAFSRDPEGALDRRTAFDWLGRLHFDSLPAVWHAEIERFFTQPRGDVKPYVGAGLKALKTKPAIRALLERSESGAGFVLDDALTAALGNRLLHALLRECLIADPQFERCLTRLREHLLLDDAARRRVALDYLCALALQSFNNEYVWQHSAREAERLGGVRERIESRLAADGAASEETIRLLLVFGCYRRLDTVQGIDAVIARAQDAPQLQQLLLRTVIEPRMERELRGRIPSIVETRDETSREVRGMYEEHPYPRWFRLDREEPYSLSEWLERELPAIPRISTAVSPRVLIAGCGTGKDAIWIASNIANARVLAVDLSLSSLSYARRMAAALGVTNIEFRQGDILGLGALDERFDLIASTGVLHHMRDPLAGLRSIAGLLKPGGLMKLGFYSARARVSVTAAREIIANERITATEPEMRTFRQRVFASDESSPLKELEHSNDFYSMSMCRDLLFHVQERQYTLRELGAMLREVDLQFLGLAELPQEAVARYRSLYPNDARMVDIASWDSYEQQYPDTFSRMFLLWCGRSVLDEAPEG